MTEAQAQVAAGVGLGAMVGFMYGVLIVCYIFRIIAEWKIFTKAGEKGWKTLIPFYNVYIEYKLTSTNKMFVIFLIVTFLAALAGQCPSEGTVAKVLIMIINILVIIFTVRRWSCLSKAFGKGVGYTAGLTFLHPIFIMILGFGKAEYIGNQDKK